MARNISQSSHFRLRSFLRTYMRVVAAMTARAVKVHVQPIIRGPRPRSSGFRGGGNTIGPGGGWLSAMIG